MTTLEIAPAYSILRERWLKVVCPAEARAAYDEIFPQPVIANFDSLPVAQKLVCWKDQICRRRELDTVLAAMFEMDFELQDRAAKYKALGFDPVI